MSEDQPQVQESGKSEFEQAGEEERLSLAVEFLYFLRDNKKWWLLPIIAVIGLVGVLAYLAGGTGATPFIYVLF